MVLVAFWGGKEEVLEEVGDERRTGQRFEEFAGERGDQCSESA